jgi:hypothetical protein
MHWLMIGMVAVKAAEQGLGTLRVMFGGQWHEGVERLSYAKNRLEAGEDPREVRLVRPVRAAIERAVLKAKEMVERAAKAPRGPWSTGVNKSPFWQGFYDDDTNMRGAMNEAIDVLSDADLLDDDGPTPDGEALLMMPRIYEDSEGRRWRETKRTKSAIWVVSEDDARDEGMVTPKGLREFRRVQ